MDALPEVSTVTSFTRRDNSGECDSGEYVFDIDHLSDCSKVVAALSNNSLIAYDGSNLRQVYSVSNAHKAAINRVASLRNNPHMFISASDDSSICQWDIRCPPTPVLKLLVEDGIEVTAASVGASDNLLAVGCEASIRFYDNRSGAGGQLLGAYDDMHTDTVTFLQFHPRNESFLASGSEDGLVCLFDTSVGAKQDAVISICNTETAVRKFGYFSEDYEGLYVISNIEGLSVWHFPSAQRLTNLPTIREQMCMDYVVDCCYDESSNDLCLLGGSYDGMGKLVTLDPAGNNRLRSSLRNGHQASIRCSTIYQNRIFTGGEDSRICCWNIGSTSSGGAAHNSTASTIGNMRVKTGATDHIHHRPY